MLHNHVFRLIVPALLAVTLLTGCATSGGRSSTADMSSGVGTSMDDYKEQLREIVRDEIVAARKNADESGADIYNYKPYYFKEFHDYPEGPDSFEVEFVEQDSKTAPLIANVTIPKMRFTTDVERDRQTVRTDMDFQRERGVETISYELRNGHWRRMASLFVASEVSNLVGGEWVPRKEEPRNEFDRFEDRPGWFRRTFNRLKVDEEAPQEPHPRPIGPHGFH